MVHYKLWYFNGTALGEPIRMLLSYGGLDFEDMRISQEDWPNWKSKMPLRQMPVLEVDSKKIYQSIPIVRYLGSILGLAGKDAWENVQIDIATETVSDFRRELGNLFYVSEDKKPAKLEELHKDFIPFYLGKLNQFATDNKGYLALGRLTYADFYFTGLIFMLKKLAGEDLFENYPGLKAVEANVLKQEKVKTYVDKRPVTEW